MPADDRQALFQRLADGEAIDDAILQRAAGGNAAELAQLRRTAHICRGFASIHPRRDRGNRQEGFLWGHLRVQEEIGHGGSSVVFRAFDTVLEREVALKLREHSSVLPRAFISEARRLARVRHPNVLAVHGAAVHDGRTGLWSDLIQGSTLSDRVRNQGPRPLAELLRAGIELASALHAVHGIDLVHGDVKPGNVVHEFGSGRIVLMDFGSARGSAEAGRFGLLGTPLSMSPEQLRGEPVGAAADLYALGVVLFYLATGEYPVQVDSASDLLRAHAGDAGRRATDMHPALPRALRPLLRDLLAADPSLRPTADVAERRLRAIATAPQRRRRRAAVAAVIGSLGIALSVSLYALYHVERAHRETETARSKEAAVSQFLAEMLVAPAPQRDGAQVRVQDVLADAVPNARRRLADQPAALVAVLRDIGHSYGGLGLHAQAQPLLAEALALSRRTHGPDAEASLELAANLAELTARGQPAEQAQATLEAALAQAEREFDPGHRIPVHLRLRLAQMHSENNRIEIAQQLLERTLAVMPAERPGQHQQYTTTLLELAVLETRRGNHLAAAQQYHEILAALDAAADSERDINGAIVARFGLANLAVARGDLAVAEEEFRALLTLSEERHGTSHRNLRVVLGNLAGVLNEQRKYEAAVPILERALELSRQHDRPADLLRLTVSTNLANALAGTGQIEQARSLREQVLADARSEFGDDHPQTLMAAINLAEQRLLDGDSAAARELAADSARRAAAVFSPQHLFVLEAREIEVRGRFLAGERQPALVAMNALCTTKQEALGADHPYALSCLLHHGELLLDNGEQADARELLTRALDKSEARFGADHPRSAELRELLARPPASETSSE